MTATLAPRARRSDRPRRHLRIAAAAALVLGMSALAPAAQADDEPISPLSSSQCDVGHFCIWAGTGYSGAFWQTATLGLQNTGISSAGSVWNRMSVDVRLYSGASGSGTIRCWQNSSANSNVAVPSVSIRTMTSTTC